MAKMIKPLLAILLLVAPLFAQAAPREPNKDGAAVQKLQGMIKSLTTEREAAKAETAKLTAELEALKKDSAKAISASETAKQQLDTELNSQKATNADVSDRLEKTNARLLEVIEKYKVLTQAKNEVSSELAKTKGTLQDTEFKLNNCVEHNAKLIESGRQLLEEYQKKGTVGALLQDEPLLQFNSVDMENIVQQYEDKVRAGQYKGDAPK